MSEHCDLCEAAILTERYFENELCWIGDCEICLVPMVVWCEHNARPSEAIKSLLLEHLSVVANRQLGEGNWSIDDHMRNIPDHYHAHARPPFSWRQKIS